MKNNIMKKLSNKAKYIIALIILCLGIVVVNAYYFQQPDQFEMYRMFNMSVTDSKLREELMLPPFKFDVNKVKAFFRGD